MGMADEIRRRFGIRTQHDREEALRAMDALRRSEAPEARLAVAIADGMVGERAIGRGTMPDGLVRIMVPETALDARPLPTDPLARRLHIAEAAMRTAARHLDSGPSEALGPELGREVRLAAVRSTTLTQVMSGSLDRTLADGTGRLGGEVRAYLAHGDAAERRHQADVDALPKRGEVRGTVERLRKIDGASTAPQGGAELRSWLDGGLRAERAIARSGLMEPSRIVATAHAVMRHAPVDGLDREPRARPDFAIGRTLDAAGRRVAVERWRTSAEATTPKAAMPDATAARRDAVRPEREAGRIAAAAMLRDGRGI